MYILTDVTPTGTATKKAKAAIKVYKIALISNFISAISHALNM